VKGFTDSRHYEIAMARFRYFAIALLCAAAAPGAGENVATGMDRFATAAYQELARGSGNLVFSPFSISTAVSMLLDGARGQTAAEMAKVLHQSYPDPAYAPAVSGMTDEIAKAANGGGNELTFANGLWVQSGFKIESDFRQNVQNYYHAPLSPLDFVGGAEQARATINNWTSAQTRGHIQNLFAPGSLDGTTRLVLTSAIYFHGKWQSAFRTGDTHPAPFHLPGGGTSQTDFMNQTGQFAYTETPGAQILELRYAGTPLVFDVLLPKSADGLAGLESSLTHEGLAGWFGGLKVQEVEVAMPRFRTESEFSLKETLSRMGMPSAFSATADFSGIDDRRDLQLANVVHKAYVDVNEEGTTAAAATGSVVRMIAQVRSEKIVFRADHPFAFLIRDRKTGTTLFAGRLERPGK
jgi:serpin B